MPLPTMEMLWSTLCHQNCYKQVQSGSLFPCRYLASRGRGKRHTLAVSNPINEVQEELRMSQQPIRPARRSSERGLCKQLECCFLHVNLVLGKLGLMHLHKVWSQIGLHSQHRLVREDSFSLNRTFVMKRLPNCGKCCPWLVCQDSTG